MPLSANIKRNGCSLGFHQICFCEILAIRSVDEMNKIVLFENPVK